jgi:hypothetical protein
MISTRQGKTEIFLGLGISEAGWEMSFLRACDLRVGPEPELGQTSICGNSEAAALSTKIGKTGEKRGQTELTPILIGQRRQSAVGQTQ